MSNSVNTTTLIEMGSVNSVVLVDVAVALVRFGAAAPTWDIVAPSNSETSVRSESVIDSESESSSPGPGTVTAPPPPLEED